MKKGFVLLIVVTLLMLSGCGSPAREAAEPEQPVEGIEGEEIAWDMIPAAEQSLEITFTDEAKARMDVEWEVRSNREIVFSLVAGSS
ncbi:MAG: hypothetical protein SCK57_05630 [Bacillota bacterium]|nr:hypothetical protein [Bacillota bacterium]